LTDAPITYAREVLHGVEPELETLVRAYYSPTKAHDGIPAYRFNWPVYWTAQAHKALYLATARRGRERWGGASGAAHYTGTLVGWVLYLVTDHPHHKGFRVAECDTLAVSHHERGQGIGRGLVEHAEPALKAMGATRIIHRHRLVYGDNSLFPKLGFRPEEVAYFKDI
jgi:GNAT superfamily N-acetyltransferase